MVIAQLVYYPRIRLARLVEDEMSIVLTVNDPIEWQHEIERRLGYLGYRIGGPWFKSGHNYACELCREQKKIEEYENA